MTDSNETLDESCDDNTGSKNSDKPERSKPKLKHRVPKRLSMPKRPKQSEARPFVCKELDCGKIYTNNSHLRRHKIVSHAGRPVPKILCEYEGCGLMLSGKQNLQKHYYRKHNANRKYAFSCNECSQGFNKHLQLKTHMYVHTGEAPFKCELEGCLKTFTSIIDFTKHKRNHKTFSCEVCGEKFHVWSMMVGHRRSSHKKNRHTCGTCKKTFNQPARLKRHELIHLNKKERSVYTCTMGDCKRFYYFRKNLIQHLKLFHLKSEFATFTCDYPGCNKVLKREMYLKRHKMLHQRPGNNKIGSKRSKPEVHVDDDEDDDIFDIKSEPST